MIDIADFLVHAPNGNLLTPNNSRTVDYFYRRPMYLFPVATPMRLTNKLEQSNIFYVCIEQCRYFSVQQLDL